MYYVAIFKVAACYFKNDTFLNLHNLKRSTILTKLRHFRLPTLGALAEQQLGFSTQ